MALVLEGAETAPASPMLIIIMGVSGAGKSTLGTSLSAALNFPYVDGDDLHPKANIEKISQGIALNDADRLPWLKVVRDTGVKLVGDDGGAILACSALKRSYRQILRGEEEEKENVGGDVETYFVWIKGERSVLLERLEERRGHFMKASMLDSQLEALEPPEGEENVIVVPLELSLMEQLEVVVDGLRKLTGTLCR